MKSTFYTRAREQTMYTYETQVNFVKDKTVNTVFTAKNKEQAILVAKKFSVQLQGVKILDATQSPFVWLSEE